jgi:zinc-finger of the FCS-type, C2-C2
MLRKINRAIEKDQIKGEMMSETLNSSSDSLSQKTSFFRVSDLFVRLSTKGLLDPDLAWSPTSPLDPKTFSNLGSFSLMSPKSANVEAKPKTWDSSKVGLGLIDALKEENLQVGTRKVLIGFEFKKPNLDLSLEPNKAESFEMKIDQVSSCLSMREIAESEDYTCITTHGPNPTKTHIFGDCILETPKGFPPEQDTIWSIEPFEICQFEASSNFLENCDYCNKKLSEEKDVYMYL